MPRILFLILLSALVSSDLISQNIKAIHIEMNLAGGQIQRIKQFPSQFVTPRNVDIWLPDNYSESQSYAVVYMHDGNMLFDSTDTWNKKEWV